MCVSVLRSRSEVIRQVGGITSFGFLKDWDKIKGWVLLCPTRENFLSGTWEGERERERERERKSLGTFSERVVLLRCPCESTSVSFWRCWAGCAIEMRMMMMMVVWWRGAWIKCHKMGLKGLFKQKIINWLEFFSHSSFIQEAFTYVLVCLVCDCVCVWVCVCGLLLSVHTDKRVSSVDPISIFWDIRRRRVDKKEKMRMISLSLSQKKCEKCTSNHKRKIEAMVVNEREYLDEPVYVYRPSVCVWQSRSFLCHKVKTFSFLHTNIHAHTHTHSSFPRTIRVWRNFYFPIQICHRRVECHHHSHPGESGWWRNLSGFRAILNF